MSLLLSTISQLSQSHIDHPILVDAVATRQVPEIDHAETSIDIATSGNA